MPAPHLVSVNVGVPKQIGVQQGRPVMSAIDKRAVPGPHTVQGVNVTGDEQADLRVHGGPDKAVYAYAEEDTASWSAELGRELWPGAYLRIIEAGEAAAGDPVELLDVPAHGVTIRLVAEAILLDHGLAVEAARAPELPGPLREWLAEHASS